VAEVAAAQPRGEDADSAACLLAETSEQLAALLERAARPRLRWLEGEVRPGGAAPASGLQGRPGREAPPHLLVVLDDLRPGSPAARLPVLGELLERAAAARTAVLWLAADRAGEPSELGVRVELGQRGTASLQETAPGGRRDGGVQADQAGLAFCEAIARRLAPLRLEGTAGRGRSRPEAGARLLGLLGLDAAALEVAETWRRPRTALLRAPIGVRPGGEPVLLDLKEAAEGGMGPHGLVVGATGSGKSELLRTIVAGLAVTHPPELLGFVLVDFKGGAAFADLAGLPQVAGMITNLASDLLLVDRVRAALEGEQLRRQRLLREAGNLADIRAYHAARAADPTMAPLPHLLVGSTSSASCWPPGPTSSTCSWPSAGSAAASGSTCCSPRSGWTRAASAASTATSATGYACGPSAQPSRWRCSAPRTPTTCPPRPAGPS
jgi:DNA segregation ATPase FtsK/SpoIIIE, S-DNA-T family